MPQPVVNSNDYLTAFNGSFAGMLHWSQLDDLWTVLRNDAAGQWYLYAVGEPPPAAPANAGQVERFITEINQLLRRDHQEDYCGVVYVDELLQPRFVKIYDPHHLGVSCGFSNNPPLPGWVMSKLAPVDLQLQGPLTGERKRWWQRIFGFKE
ncbi:MAG: hypothetical protein HY273_06480 [Gammaproteobacteria bacterium]|nr:hypothetical protein [Gammaproteobacteria bacterium]